MLNWITKRTAFYALGGGVGAGLLEAVSEIFLSHEAQVRLSGNLLVDVGIWFALIALGIAIGLITAQNVYLKRTPHPATLPKPILVGLLSGFIAGAVAQFVYSMAQDLKFSPLVILVIQALCWGLAGLGAGLGVAFFVPNYPKTRAILAGFAGGAIGGAVFVLLGVFGIFSAGAARIIGCAILGAAIGLTISAVEEVLRAAWLTVIWAKNETTTVSLGKDPVILGSAADATVRLPRNKFPPVTAILTVRNGRVMMENKLENKTTALPNGSKINIGKISIVIHTRKDNAENRA